VIVTAPLPSVGDKVILLPAISLVTPPLAAYEALIELSAFTACEAEEVPVPPPPPPTVVIVQMVKVLNSQLLPL